MRAAAIATVLSLTLAVSTANAADEKSGAKENANAESLNDDAPPPAPYAKGLVLDASAGALGWIGKFHDVAPPGPWFHGQIGWEFFKWLMVFVEGELGFSDTSNVDDPPRIRTFPMYGFGAGARFTWHITDRIGIYGQPAVGEMQAHIARNALGIHGFGDAEELGLWLGLRAGFEWYQIDRHMALGFNVAVRDAMGFKQLGPSSGTPLALDGGISLRYAF